MNGSCFYGLLMLLTWQLYKSAIGNIFEEEEWGPLEYAIMAKHFDRQGKTPYMYHSVSISMPSWKFQCTLIQTIAAVNNVM